MNAILIFTLATIINVVLNTIRSITTIKCGKWISAVMNAICYGFYPLIVMLTAKDTVTIITNMCITALANFICVWIIKYVEEKAKKDVLWKIEMAIPMAYNSARISGRLDGNNIPNNYIKIGKWNIFNCYCATQKESEICKQIADEYEGKISAYESKSLI